MHTSFLLPGEAASPAKAELTSPAKWIQSPTRRVAVAAAAAHAEAPMPASPVKAEDAKAAGKATSTEKATVSKKKTAAKLMAKAAEAENPAAPRLRFITAEEEIALVVRTAARMTPAHGFIVNLDPAVARSIASSVVRSSSRPAGRAGCASARNRRPR